MKAYRASIRKIWTNAEPNLYKSKKYPLGPLLQVKDVLILHQQRGGVHFRQKDVCWKDVMKHLQKMDIWDSR